MIINNYGPRRRRSWHECSVAGCRLTSKLNSRKMKMNLFAFGKREKFKVRVYDRNGAPTTLHVAAADNDPTMIAFLLSKGAQVDARNRHGQTALHWASWRCANDSHFRTCELLLAYGADANARDDFGNVALLLSMRSRNPRVFKLLVDKNADSKLANDDGVTPLHRAAVNNSPHMLEYLLSKGADVGARDKAGRSPLHSAAFVSSDDSHLQVCQLLLTSSAEVNARDVDGDTPLHLSVYHGRGNEELVRLLLDSGAEVQAENKLGETALHLAARNNQVGRTIELLVSRGAEIDAKNKNGHTAFHLAAFSDRDDSHLGVCEALMASKADVSALDNFGHTPLQISLRNGLGKIAELIKAGDTSDGLKNLDKDKGFAHCSVL